MLDAELELEDDKKQETKSDPFIDMVANLSGNVNQMMSLGQKISSEIFYSQMSNNDSLLSDPLNSMQSWFDSSASLMKNPDKLLDQQLNLWQNYMELCSKAVDKLNNPDKEILFKERFDKRFGSDAWNDSFFNFIKETYFITSESIMDMIEKSSEDLDDKSRNRMLFFTKQYIDALSPSNFPMTNPDVVKETIRTGGENLVKGLNNLLKDIERGNGKLMISQTDYSAFKVGEDLATTSGKVVYRNELIELIQYEPTTQKVYAQPLLIMPPFINKYYILDMRKENSMIKWLADQGFTVFVVSWCNPTEEHSEYSFEEYMKRGLFCALEKTLEITKHPKASVVGYCIAGTMLSMALSYMKSIGDDRIGNVTLFASQSDFSEAGELSYFVDKDQIRNIEKIMRDHGGFLEGHEMASTFNLLRANDLIWSFVVNNYLLGKEPFPFDLLFWNADTTRMPMRLQLDYLENCYLNNDLSNNKMIIADHIVNLKSIDIPMYIQASKEDHIAPAISVYKGSKLYSGDVRFVLAGSGHIAGVINHPDKNKYNHWIYSGKDIPENLNNWIKAADEYQGSWWNDWSDWLKKNSGKLVAKRNVKNGICDAPGEYVLS